MKRPYRKCRAQPLGHFSTEHPANNRCEMANFTSSFNVHKTMNKRDTEPLPPRHSWPPVTFSPPPVAEMTGRRKKGLKGFFNLVATAVAAVTLHLLTGSVSFRVLECSPLVRASRRLSASLYTYSSDLARNSGRLPNHTHHKNID